MLKEKSKYTIKIIINLKPITLFRGKKKNYTYQEKKIHTYMRSFYG